MDITNLEENLNNFETNPERAIALALQNSVTNQALLQTILDLQVRLISTLSKTDYAIVSKDAQKIFEDFLAEAQVRTSNLF